MGIRLTCTLNEHELEALEEAINHALEPEVHQRSIVIRFLHLGNIPEAVAQMVLVTSTAIYAWHNRWHEGGIGGRRKRTRRTWQNWSTC